MLDGRTGLTLLRLRLQLERDKICSGRLPPSTLDKGGWSIDGHPLPRRRNRSRCREARRCGICKLPLFRRRPLIFIGFVISIGFLCVSLVCQGICTGKRIGVRWWRWVSRVVRWLVGVMMVGEQAIFGRAVLHFRRPTAQQQCLTVGRPPKSPRI